MQLKQFTGTPETIAQVKLTRIGNCSVQYRALGAGNVLTVLKGERSREWPTAAKWRVDSIKHYDLMVELWAADRATGTGVRTARQARRQRVGPRVSVDLNQNIEYTPEQPDWTRYRDPTPPSPHPSVDEYSPGQTQSVPSVPSGAVRQVTAMED
ncbi:hypothetical protein LR48_Vigan10g088700 [Vigna angularis]|uniref:Uncharacterized protein n=1 Tax=Phaseolus angularis TaxID=3914 RepID=A0A0L9VIX7_PHAAN|nr:hypothetical protein LR48_Vigan10g088700 [Vigna angularis]